MEDGVRVNAVSPGATKTARFQATRVVDPQADGFANANRSTATPSRPRSPKRSRSSPARAAKFINGQVLRVDGGIVAVRGLTLTPPPPPRRLREGAIREPSR